MLEGQAKTDYQREYMREYMRKRRSNVGLNNQVLTEELGLNKGSSLNGSKQELGLNNQVLTAPKSREVYVCGKRYIIEDK